MFPEPPGRDPGDGASCPALTLGPHGPEILTEAIVHHRRVASSAELRVVPEELLVAEVEEVTLGVVEGREDVCVDFSVSTPELPVEVWTSLTGELAVEDENVSTFNVLLPVLLTALRPVLLPVLLTGGPEDWLGGERRGREEGGEERFLLAVLPVLGSSDVAATELKTVADVDDPEDEGSQSVQWM